MRENIKLQSEEETGVFYTTTKEKRNTPGKIRLRKYDKKLRRHVWFKEVKLK